MSWPHSRVSRQTTTPSGMELDGESVDAPNTTPALLELCSSSGFRLTWRGMWPASAERANPLPNLFLPLSIKWQSKLMNVPTRKQDDEGCFGLWFTLRHTHAASSLCVDAVSRHGFMPLGKTGTGSPVSKALYHWSPLRTVDSAG